MADNTVLNQGAGGDVIATDDISGVKHQMVKMEFGQDGTATPVSTADPLPVAILGTPALAADAATQTTLEAIRVLINAGINVNVSNGSIAITAAALPLPAGASSEATLQAIAVLLGGGISVTGTVAVNNFPATQPVSGVFFQATQPVSIATMPTTPVTGTFFQATQPVSAAALPLPSGASTEATLATLNGKVPSLGQALAAASTPVVLTAAQLTTLTPPAAIVGFNLETTQVAMSAKLPSTLGAKTTANSMAVNIASDQTVATSEVAPTTVFNGKTTVTTATTRVALGASTTVKSVTIKASTTNTGIIYVGNSTVAAANGFELLAGQSVSMDISNLATVFIDASVSGSSVTYISVN